MTSTPSRFRLASQAARTYSGRPLTPRNFPLASRTLPNLVASTTWLRRPRRFELRLSPLALGGLALAGLGLAALLARDLRPGPLASGRATAAATHEAEVVLVRFVLATPGAHQVALAGDFNGWDPGRTSLENAAGRGTFATNLWLPRGTHEYMFVVDGQWVPDPSAPAHIPDGFGRTNSLLSL